MIIQTQLTPREAALYKDMLEMYQRVAEKQLRRKKPVDWLPSEYAMHQADMEAKRKLCDKLLKAMPKEA